LRGINLSPHLIKLISNNNKRTTRRGTRGRNGGKRNNRRNNSRNNPMGTDADVAFMNATRGDIPKLRRFDQVTISARLPPVSKGFTVRQALAPVIVTASGTASVASNIAAVFSNLDNAAAFGNLFDQYRIDCLRITIRPQQNALGLNTNSTTTLTDFYAVIDYDNGTALTSTAAAREYDNCMILTPAESGERIFIPRMALAAYSGAFTSYANVEPQWIDTASTGVIHYGLKYFIPAVTSGQTMLQSWEINVEYYVSFRSLF